jgi:hypothetical protein
MQHLVQGLVQGADIHLCTPQPMSHAFFMRNTMIGCREEDCHSRGFRYPASPQMATFFILPLGGALRREEIPLPFQEAI